MADLGRVREIFVGAVGKVEPEQWDVYLAGACGDDADLRSQVERLLQAHRQAGSLLNEPVVDRDETRDFADSASTLPGGTIGPYKLLEQIGEGGFGVVYLAEQTEPVRRKVALKILKPGMDTRQVVARFEAERQALAIMDHPNIARVFDGGATAAGRPYFVMELVKGTPITEYCDQNHLTPRQRLELFVSVCQAVQHAHQKGVIHRDIKPSNVLVSRHDSIPVVKVIDFGVAKAVGQALTDKTLFTGLAQMIGTPLYMSPEQAGMSDLDVDTRSDIYSLGVLLYELLTGSTPFTKERFKKAAFDEIRRIIREEEPPRPSTRLNDSKDSLPSISAQRHTEPAKLTKLVRGELDWIVMKSLEKDRNRRYETANGFAADVQRYLADEPVQACPPSATYRLRKFAKKNRVALTTAASIALLLVGGVAVSTWQAIRATRAESIARQAQQAEADRAEGERLAKLDAQEKAEAEKAAREEEERQRKFAEAITKFVWEDFLALTSVEGQDRFGGEGMEVLGKDATLQQLLDRAAEKLRNRKDLAPLTEAALCWIVGVNYRGAGDPAKGVPFLQRAVELRLQNLGQDNWETMVAQNSLAWCYLDVGDFEKSLPLAEKVLQTRKAVLGAEHPDSLRSIGALADVYRKAGRLDLAIPLVEEALRRQKTKLGSDDRDTLTSMHNLADAYIAVGRFDKAMPLAEEAATRTKAQLGPDHRMTLSFMQTLASAYKASGQLDKALPLFEETLGKLRVKLGHDHPTTLVTMNNLAGAYRANGQPEKAMPLLEETLARTKVKLGPDHPDMLSTMHTLAHTYRDLVKFDKALPLFEDTVAKRRVRFGPDDFKTLQSMHNLADAFRESGQPAKAIPIFEETLAKWNSTLGPDHHETRNTMHALARAYQAAGQTARALPLYEESFEKQKAKLGPDDPITLTTMNNLALAYHAIGQTTKAQALLEETLAKRKVKLGPDHRDTINSMHNLAVAYGETGEFVKALPLYKEALAMREAKLGPDHPDTLLTMVGLAAYCWTQKQLNESVPIFERMLPRQEKKLGRGHPNTQMTVTNLGVNYKDAGRLAEAIPLLEEGYRSSERHPILLYFAGPNLLDAYRKAGKSDEAAKLMDKLLVDCHTQLPKTSPQLAYQLTAIGRARIEDREYAKAEEPLREALAIGEKTQPNDWKTPFAQVLLGSALLGQKRFDDSEPLLLKGYEGIMQRSKNIPPIHAEKMHLAIDRLIELYTATNQPDDAAKWRKELETIKAAQKPEPRR